MLRIKVGILGVLAVFAAIAVGAFGASSASAAFTLTEKLCSGGVNVNFCWAATETGTLFELQGEETFEALADNPEGLPILLTAVIGGSTFDIECADAHIANGTLSQPEPLVKDWVGRAIITFSGCKVTGTLGEKCVVPVEKSTNEVTGTPTAKNDEQVSFKPTTGTVFIEFAVTSKAGQTCPATLIGNKKVTGTQVGNWVEPLVDLASHLLVVVEKSELLEAEQPAELDLSMEFKPLNLGTDLWDISNEA